MNLAGIIPVAGQKSVFGLPWHDVLMPIGDNFCAVERAIAECLYAGCKSIWIICSIDQEPLMRFRLGDKAKDPESFSKLRREKREFDVCIYYIPILVHDMIRRNCLPWSIIHGVNSVDRTLKKLSPHLVPEKFYVAFPYGVYEPKITSSNRGLIKKPSTNVLLSYDGQTVRDGNYLGFTLNVEKAKELGQFLKQKSYTSPEKYAARNFTLEDIFSVMQYESEDIVPIDNYYELSSWQEYAEGLNNGEEIKKQKSLFPQKEWNGIGVNDEDDAY